jgi:hypothetical protein
MQLCQLNERPRKTWQFENPADRFNRCVAATGRDHSGNTGIGLAIACAQDGYPLVVVMADSFSVELRN